MIEYAHFEHPELSLIRDPRGNYFHQKGNYKLILNGLEAIPVNRSYSVENNGPRGNGFEPLRYKKDELIHENVEDGSVLLQGEFLVDVYGKPLLFILNKDCSWLSSRDTDKCSDQAKRMLGLIRANLARGDSFQQFYLGAFGSHRASLAGVDSDIDLVGWVEWQHREEFIKTTLDFFREQGFKTSRETGRDAEYAVRYAKRFAVSPLTGWYLASKRTRLTSPGGVPLSFQCLDLSSDHDAVKLFLEGINGNWESREVELACTVVSARASYNLPKIWELDINGEHFKAVSFSWMHQGMGDDSGRFGDEYIFRGAMVENNSGKFLYLAGADHFILPKRLL